MMRVVSRYVMSIVAPAFMILAAGCVWGQATGVTPRDCVNVKYIWGVWMSMSGTRVAYLVKAPNIERNSNDYQLYVREIGDKSLSPGKLLFTGAEISDVKWLSDDNRISMLMPIGGIKTLVFVNALTGTLEPAFEASGNIEYYSTDSTGNTVAYSITEPQTQKSNIPTSTYQRIASGYRVRFGEKVTDGWPVSTIYIRQREQNGEWSPPQAITIENPFTHVKATHLTFARGLSLSPNGKRLLFTYISDTVPDEWKKDPLVKRYLAESLFEILILYDVDKTSTTLGFKSLSPASVPLWANDSRSFLVNATSPIGSHWEAEDVRDHHASAADGNLFVVNVDSGEVEEVARNVPDHHEPPLFWQKNGDVIVHSDWTTIARLHRFKDSWREIEHNNIAQKKEDRFLYLVSNGTEIMGTYETITTPRELFEYDPDQRHIRLLTDLNPQLRLVRFAPVETVHWSTAGGLNVSGLLFIPPEYAPGTRYPLVIQTKGNDQGWFYCDAAAIRDPSFAPQPIATAGMMYLIRTTDEDWKFQEEVDKRPQGYPGGIGEAVQQMDIWDSAIDALDKKGMVDPSKVGIIGFSRTGWQVEFDLVHSHTRYAAATATDNAQYSLSEYWMIPWASVDEERMYGGPPYGRTLENWQKYSISFNLDKVHTPLLMEEMGYGTREDDQHLVPRSLAVRFEISSGLTRLGKPVEMYFYPDEGHQPEHPKARLASLQRNLDWYRFWLQGYERPHPEDPDQYKRWEHLRELRDADAKPSSLTSTSTSAPN
jgi:dipeptidyl aminopeptidase/acylaminoacyl peptidase